MGILCTCSTFSSCVFIYEVVDFLKVLYLFVVDTGRFHEIKKEWGFKQLVSIKTFKDLSEGYLFDDSCAFGAEVLVINPTLNSVCLSVFGRNDISNPTFRWEIKEFSKMVKHSHKSEEFSSGGAKWYALMQRT